MPLPAFHGQTAEELDARITEILDAREAAGRPLTLEHLAYALGIGMTALRCYAQHDPEDEDRVKAYDEHSSAVKKAHARCLAWHADRALEPRANPAGAIFLLKAGFGYRETSVVEHQAGPGTLIRLDLSAPE